MSRSRIEELKRNVEKLEAELKAKDAIISEAVATYSALPPHPDNYALIEVIGQSCLDL